jgi:hypothetical protein
VKTAEAMANHAINSSNVAAVEEEDVMTEEITVEAGEEILRRRGTSWNSWKVK